MKKKILCFILLIISILTIVFYVQRNIGASYTLGLGGVEYATDFAHLGYDTVKNISYERAYLSDGASWQKCHQVMCLHHGNTASKPYGVLVAIVDINPNGEDPSAGVAYTASGSVDLPSNDLNKFAAAFSYYVENEISDSSGANYNMAKHPFNTFWEGGYRSYLEGCLGISLTRNSVSAGFDTTGAASYQFAQDYMNNPSPSITYSGRLFIFSAGTQQARIIVFGAPSEYTPQVEIKKYVTNIICNATEITDASGNTVQVSVTNPIYSGTERRNMSLADKRNSPVSAQYGETEITYKIEITNPTEQEITGTFQDEPDGYLSHVSGTESQSFILAPGATETIEVTYFLPSTVQAGVNIENKAKFIIDATGDEITDSDFVIIGELPEPEEQTDTETNTPPTGDYQKYITKVTKPDGTVHSYSRENRSNDDKYLDPVEVEKGDIVTYEIKFENTSGEDLNWIEFTDTMDTGLTSSKGQSFTEDMGAVDANDYETYSFDVEVTASNMTLQNLENKVDGFNGQWTEVTTYTSRVTYPVYSNGQWTTQTYIYTWTEEEDIDISFSGSNMNADYVRLADPEIGGMVWIENTNPPAVPDESQLDGLKTSGEAAKPNVPVKLYDETGSVIAETTTDGNGEYTFGRVQKGKTKIDGLNGNFYYEQSGGFKSYIVEFEYDGIRYEDTKYSGTNRLGSDSSIVDSNYKVDSSAQELNRQGFNDKLETIAYDKAYAGTTGNESSITLEYDKSGHESEIKQTADTIIKARSFQLFHTTDGETEYLKYINLGLYERAIADLSLTKDVVQADVSVNGFSATYTYNQGATDAYKLATPYVLNIYEADHNFRTSSYSDSSIVSAKGGSSNDLNIVLTFKITIKNESRYNLYAVVREVIDISANSLSIIDVVAEDGSTLSHSKSSNYNTASSYNYQGYEADFITGLNTVLAKDATTSLTVRYSVDKDSSGGIILGTKPNIAEIGAFSIYFDASASTPAGTVDEDSNPGIVNTGDVDIDDDSLYEDHTYQTSIIIQLRPDDPTDPDPDPEVPVIPPPGDDDSYDKARIIKGNVWEDINEVELTTGQKVGDGIRNASEDGALNVTVLLLESVKDSNGNLHLIDTGVMTKTDSNGDYVLQDAEKLYAGEYVVRFIYGNNGSELVSSNEGHTIRFSGQDYKSTIYTPVGGTTDETKVVEATAFAEANETNQISTAKDSELRRLEVIDYSTTINHPLDEILKATDANELDELAANTAMFADTQKFNTQIEYAGNTGITLSGKHESLSGLKLYKFIISDVNFGLIERPITKLDLLDDIKEIIATTSTGEELIHIYFDISYELKSSGKVERTIQLNEVKSKGFENVQLLDKNDTTKGFRYVNIDTEILQGMRITVKYQFAISNVGEIDTSNQNLINMVKNYDVGNTADELENLIGSTIYKYGTGSGLSSDVLKDYSYENMTKAIASYSGAYKTIISDVTNSSAPYNYGYFLGNTYYTGVYQSTTDKEVETRVDQIISYVDNDLVFKPEENLSKEGAKFLNYNAEEIAEKGLLKDITLDMYLKEVVELLLDNNDVSYMTYADDDINNSNDTNKNLDAEPTKNNLAFNVEDAVVNKDLYKFLTVVKDVTNVPYDKLYWIDLEASRILASENDLDDVAIDNLAEIVKMTNTVGRKTYIEMTGTTSASGKTGQIGNTPDVLPDPDSVVGNREIDTNYTETVTFSPPTGLSAKEQKAEKVTFTTKVIIGVIITGFAVGGTIYLIKKKKFYT